MAIINSYLRHYTLTKEAEVKDNLNLLLQHI